MVERGQVMRVLLIDDDEDEYVLLNSLLARASEYQFAVSWTPSYEDALRRMMAREFDAYLVDYRLGPRSGIELLEEAVAAGCEEPLIVLTGEQRSDLDSAALQAGAVDFIDKQQLSAPLLERSLRYAVERAKGARLAAALRDQKQTAQVRERLLGIVGHDLRGPLASITTAAHYLLKAPEHAPLEARQHMAGVIISSSGRMAKMINELLDFTRARLGNGIPVERRAVDAAEICRRVLDEMRITHPNRAFEFNGPAQLGTYCDPERIAQLIANLMKNAVDYGDPAKPVALGLSETSEAVVIAVHNAGPAIPQDLVADIFDPFRRGAPDVKRSSDGLGLGLYIVERIASGHGGQVAVESTSAQGTTFTATIPRDGVERRPKSA
jgi:sigma-B regulation protein RsbU (phosphoserine phosphatase)